tara:strand:- start:2038 stop:3156 length:1119 start_codon:yes stop_codon:yes gene_type:complete
MNTKSEYKINVNSLLNINGVISNSTNKIESLINKNSIVFDLLNENTIQNNLKEFEKLYPGNGRKHITPDTWLQVDSQIAKHYLDNFSLPVAKANDLYYIGFILKDIDKHSLQQHIDVLKEASNSIDRNNNGIPDKKELDLNNNGIPDKEEYLNVKSVLGDNISLKSTDIVLVKDSKTENSLDILASKNGNLEEFTSLKTPKILQFVIGSDLMNMDSNKDFSKAISQNNTPDIQNIKDVILEKVLENKSRELFGSSPVLQLENEKLMNLFHKLSPIYGIQDIPYKDLAKVGIDPRELHSNPKELTKLLAGISTNSFEINSFKGLELDVSIRLNKSMGKVNVSLYPEKAMNIEAGKDLMQDIGSKNESSKNLSR